MTQLNDTLWALRVTLLCWWRGHAWSEFVRTRHGRREACRYCMRCDRTEVVNG